MTCGRLQFSQRTSFSFDKTFYHYDTTNNIAQTEKHLLLSRICCTKYISMVASLMVSQYIPV